MRLYEPILKELAAGMLQTAETKQDFSNNALIDATLIFQTVWMDKIYDNQNYDGMSIDDRLKMVESACNELRKLIHTYTNLDPKKLVNEY